MTAHTSLLEADAQNRLQALELNSFIVEAPAGAGKTELLTQRYLKLLQNVNAPEEIIAITFTNKAAAEMRLRILDSLIAAANQKKPNEVHKQITYELSLQALEHADMHNWQLIENPSRLRIFTIDSLCAHLARQMPLMSRFGAQPRIAEDASSLYAQAAAQTLALLEDTQHNDVVKTALRYVDNDATKLSNLLVLMLAKRDQWLLHAQGEFDAEQLQNTLHAVVSETLQATAHAVPFTLQHSLMPIARFAAANLLAENPDVEMPLINWQTPIDAQPESLPMWQALADFVLTEKGEPRKEKGLNVKFGFPPTDEGKAQKIALAEMIAAINDPAVLHRVRSLPNTNNTDWQIVTTLSKLLNLAVAQLWLTFQRTGEVDFVEIAQRATHALGDNLDEGFNQPSELALKLDYQIQHLLVDEFQDTSPSQIALLRQLTLGWQNGDNTIPNSGDGRTLFCVGDPMQSIYRFRKANVGLFIDAATLGIGDIQLKKLQLYRNNRSCPPVVDWINATFEHIFPAHDDVTQGAIHYRPFIATKNNKNQAGIKVCPIIKQNDESTDTAKQREAEAVIGIIQHERAANPNAKIAILVRSKKHLTPLVSQLRRSYQDISFQAVEIEPLAGRQIVQDLLSLTNALHHRADRVHWLAILRAPWCGLNLHDLHTLAGENHHATIWSLMQDDEIINKLEGKQRLKHLREVLLEAFITQGLTNVSRWVRGIWLMLNGTACLWEQADIVDVQAFFSCLDKLDRSNQFSPERMTIEITKLFATPDINGEHLQMMSIHKSKGLEFDCVILLGLGAEAGGNNSEKPLVLWEEVTVNEQTELLAAPYIPKSFIPKDLQGKNSVSAYDYLETLEAERDANEAARVLYVAATRAERKLYLVGIANQNAKGEVKPSKNSYLNLLWDKLSPAFEMAELNAKSVDEGANTENDISSFTPKLIRLNHLQIPSVLQTEKVSKKLTSKIPVKRNQQAISLNLSVPSVHQNAGSLAHLYMEMIANGGLEDWPASRIDASTGAMRFWLLQKKHAKNEIDILVQQIITALKKTIASPQGAWMLASRTSRQAELCITTLDENNMPLEHRVDLTFIEANVRWIIDYKFTGEISNLNLVIEQYKPQLARYARLFAHENLPIKTAVFFLSLGQLVEIQI